MAMSEAFKNYLLETGSADVITHIGLVIVNDTEISGGSPAYARQAVTWDAASSGAVSPTADLTFDIPTGVTVAGWRGFTALTSGTNYGGADLTNEVYAGQGEYKLLSASTSITLSDPT